MTVYTITINGGNNSAGDDKVNITGTSSTISADTNIFGAGAFDNIEALDLTGATFGSTAGNDNDFEYLITGSLINSWTKNDLTGGSLKLTLDAEAATRFEFTNSTGTKYGGDDSDTTAITSGTYTLDNGTEVIISGL